MGQCEKRRKTCCIAAGRCPSTKLISHTHNASWACVVVHRMHENNIPFPWHRDDTESLPPPRNTRDQPLSSVHRKMWTSPANYRCQIRIDRDIGPMSRWLQQQQQKRRKICNNKIVIHNIHIHITMWSAHIPCRAHVWPLSSARKYVAMSLAHFRVTDLPISLMPHWNWSYKLVIWLNIEPLLPDANASADNIALAVAIILVDSCRNALPIFALLFRATL